MCALHRALAIAVVLVAATIPALPQGEVGLVSGRVTDERGVPLAGAVVTLSGPGVIGVFEEVTRVDGRYWFRAVPGGHPLTIQAAVEGRPSVRYEGYTARRDGMVTIDFVLRAPGDHDILVLVEQGIPYHEVALDGALSTMPGRHAVLEVADTGPDTVRRLRGHLAGRPSAVLAIGETAARLARRQIRDVPVVHSMVPAPLKAGLDTRNLCGVPLNGGFEAQIEHLLHVAPETRTIATIYDPGRLGREIRELKRAARGAGIDLVAAHVHGEDLAGVTAALDDLAATPIDAFLLLLDPRLVDTAAFERIARFAGERNVPLSVPDAALAGSGRTFCFGPGFFEQGAFAGLLVRRIVEGKIQPVHVGMVYPAGDDTPYVGVPHEKQSPEDVLPPAGHAAMRVARDD